MPKIIIEVKASNQETEALYDSIAELLTNWIYEESDFRVKVEYSDGSIVDWTS